MKKLKPMLLFIITTGLFLALLRDSHISFFEKSESIDSLVQLGLTARDFDVVEGLK